jgi:cytochrome c
MADVGGRRSPAAWAAVLFAMTLPCAARAADPVRGQALFEECAACHRLSGATDAGDVGPALAGVLNRAAGARSDFRYSRALSSSGIVWTLASIDAYVADPQGLVRGNRMAYAGMPDAADRADLMAFLATALTEADRDAR